jgi:hypothetical protein
MADYIRTTPLPHIAGIFRLQVLLSHIWDIMKKEMEHAPAVHKMTGNGKRQGESL